MQSKIIEFINSLLSNEITEEETRKFLLSLNNDDFITLIKSSPSNIESATIIGKMIENNIAIISEIIESLTTEEKLNALKVISKEFTMIESMIFKTLPITTVTDLFLKEPEKYKEEIESYIETPRLDKDKDILIATILSNSNLSKLFTKETLEYFKNLISDNNIILDINYNIPDITFEEIRNEIARYLANLEYRKSSNINLGIHEKISSKDLYKVFTEVNKGLENIDSPLLTEEEIIKELELPLYKAILFIDNCLTLTEEEILDILIKQYPEEKEFLSNKTLDQLTQIVKDFDLPEIDIDNYNEKNVN